ncbi:hypothetical protein E2P81_ATG03827 [Venturia nashicola]|uniref:EamA domain-containing protein n=1 Tax=Venturia nashicola TaxID=86259 RepID=A0A4Z1PK80_9PEZI|nr:hypothetical protein E6O75_ATG03919 [Venturia nashicola]TLD38152.1 hypothetical protein E2P81_ATG03827 [Venturia nashicola]
MTSPAPNQSAWQTIAITGGIFAALNGVFAKLTTNDLTSSWSATLSNTLPINASLVEVILRIAIGLSSFGLSATMWTFYTKALASSPSAVHVNIVNTTSNFLMTAVLGALIFGEKLPALWFLGAAFLVMGGVIIGRREETGDGGKEKKEL